MSLKELKELYEKAVKDHLDGMKEADDFDLKYMEEPSVMLVIENPQPKEGSAIEVMPGLPGTVFMSMYEETEAGRTVNVYVKVRCEDIVAFLTRIGMKVDSVNELISKFLGGQKH